MISSHEPPCVYTIFLPDVFMNCGLFGIVEVDKKILLCRCLLASRSTLSEWYCHFCIQVADVSAREGDWKGAYHHIENALKVAEENELEDLKVLHLS